MENSRSGATVVSVPYRSDSQPARGDPKNVGTMAATAKKNERLIGWKMRVKNLSRKGGTTNCR